MWFDLIWYSAHGTFIDYSSVPPSSPAVPQRVPIIIPLNKQQPSSLSPSTPRHTAAVPAPTSTSTTHAPTSASPNPASTPNLKSLAALESMLTTLTSRPSQKTDRLAALRAAKAAIQDGQQHQGSKSHTSPHPLPPRPSVAVIGGSSNGGMGSGGGPGILGPGGGSGGGNRGTGT